VRHTLRIAQTNRQTRIPPPQVNPGDRACNFRCGKFLQVDGRFWFI
jgi:hypothetical protein